jgi:hypothetical protein
VGFADRRCGLLVSCLRVLSFKDGSVKHGLESGRRCKLENKGHVLFKYFPDGCGPLFISRVPQSSSLDILPEILLL